MPCGRLYGLYPLTKSAFSSIEPKSHSGSIRTSCPVSSSARKLISSDAANPSPATALAVASSLVVIASWLSTRTEVTRLCVDLPAVPATAAAA